MLVGFWTWEQNLFFPSLMLNDRRGCFTTKKGVREKLACSEWGTFQEPWNLNLIFIAIKQVLTLTFIITRYLLLFVKRHILKIDPENVQNSTHLHVWAFCVQLYTVFPSNFNSTFQYCKQKSKWKSSDRRYLYTLSFHGRPQYKQTKSVSTKKNQNVKNSPPSNQKEESRNGSISIYTWTPLVK